MANIESVQAVRVGKQSKPMRGPNGYYRRVWIAIAFGSRLHEKMLRGGGS